MERVARESLTQPSRASALGEAEKFCQQKYQLSWANPGMSVVCSSVRGVEIRWIVIISIACNDQHNHENRDRHTI